MNLRYKDIVLVISILTACHFRVLGQNEYLSTLNYNNLQVSRIGSAIPGITWVNTDNTAYDANHQRFFFQGSGINSVPFYLYTINAVTGAVISHPVCPSNNPNGIVFGLQYDNKTDSSSTGPDQLLPWGFPSTVRMSMGIKQIYLNFFVYIY